MDSASKVLVYWLFKANRECQILPVHSYMSSFYLLLKIPPSVGYLAGKCPLSRCMLTFDVLVDI